MDSLFDLADDVLDGVEQALGSNGSPAERPARKSSAAASARRGSAPSSSSSTAVARRQFRVIEAIENGIDVWVVTDGYDRAECSSAAFAARVRDSLG